MSTALSAADLALTTAQKDEFVERGFVIVPGLLTPSELRMLVDRIDGLLEGRYPKEHCKAETASQHSDQDAGRHIKQVMPTRYPISDPVLRAISEHRALQAVACELLSVAKVEVFQQQALIKDPGLENGTPWHQDDYYWDSNGRSVTAWFPLESLTPEIGTMCVFPGTHRGALLHHGPAGGVSNFHEITAPLDAAQAVPLLMKLGSASFHHSKLIHGAFGNRGKSRRIALAQHYRPV